MKDYGKMVIFADQQYLVEIVGITKRTTSGAQPVNLMNEGLGGFSPGPGEVTVTIRYAIPADGMEFNFDQAVSEDGYHNVQINAGAVAYIGEGKYTDNEITSSTGSAIEGTVNFTGDREHFQ